MPWNEIFRLRFTPLKMTIITAIDTVFEVLLNFSLSYGILNTGEHMGLFDWFKKEKDDDDEEGA